MTLGTAASSSMRNVNKFEICRGASSARKTEAATPSGTAISSAVADVTTVPKMNGSAPNSSITGSQVRVHRNSQPNLWRARPEFPVSSKNNKGGMREKEAAAMGTKQGARAAPGRGPLKNKTELP